jgi:hypothetical protein
VEIFTALNAVAQGALLGKGSITPVVNINDVINDVINLTVIGAPVIIIPEPTTLTTIAAEWKTTARFKRQF